uniref:DDE Tnp4 domain-containing protein n=1 Tax=Romanomermis culicivorax TaxID=13658 RepID=A0A915I4Q1_ROMCU
YWKPVRGCKKRQQLLTAARRGEFEAKCKLAGIEIENPGFFKRVWRGIARRCHELNNTLQVVILNIHIRLYNAYTVWHA